MNEEIERHMKYLEESAEPYATAKSASTYYERFLKSIESKHFLEATGTIDQRKSFARTHPEYLQALEDAKSVDYDSALLYARREAAKIAISLFQTTSKAQIGTY